MNTADIERRAELQALYLLGVIVVGISAALSWGDIRDRFFTRELPFACSSATAFTTGFSCVATEQSKRNSVWTLKMRVQGVSPYAASYVLTCKAFSEARSEVGTGMETYGIGGPKVTGAFDFTSNIDILVSDEAAAVVCVWDIVG